MGIEDGEDLISHLQQSPAIKDITKELYIKKIQTIQTEIWKTDVLHILKHPKEFVKKLTIWADKNDLGTHGKNNYFSAVISLFYHNETFRLENWDLFQQWKKIHLEIRHPINEQYATNTPTPRQAESFVEYHECVRIMNTLGDGTFEKLLLSMYLIIPPVRSNFANLKIFQTTPKQKPKGNYIVLGDDPVLVIQQHKTEKNFQEIRSPLPDALVKQIHLSLEKVPRDYLFVSTRDHTAFKTERAFNAFANRILSKVIKPTFSLTTFRHVFLSRTDLDLKNKTGLELQKFADLMGHSVGQQKKYIFMHGV